MFEPVSPGSSGLKSNSYICDHVETPFKDDFEAFSKYWIARNDGVSRIDVRDSILMLEIGPTEALYYSNTEISDGDFNCLRWWEQSLEFKARFIGKHYGSAGIGFWNYSMQIDRSLPIWFIYLRAKSNRYPLNGFYIQMNNVFTPIKYFTKPPLIVKLAHLLKPLLPIKFTTLKPTIQDLNLEEWHIYRIEWRNKNIRFKIDDKVIAEASPPRRERFRIDAWIDNAVFTPLKWDYAQVYRHITHENRREAKLEIDYISIE